MSSRVTDGAINATIAPVPKTRVTDAAVNATIVLVPKSRITDAAINTTITLVPKSRITAAVFNITAPHGPPTPDAALYGTDHGQSFPGCIIPPPPVIPPSGAYVGDTPPSAPTDGRLWWDSSTTYGILRVWYAAANAWIDASPPGSGGAGGSTLTQFSAYAPLTSPSVLDDDFTAATLAAKWATVGGTGTLTTTTDTAGRGVKLSLPGVGGGGFNASGVEQVLPAGPFSIFVDVTNATPFQFGMAGLYLRRSASNVRISHGLYHNTMFDKWMFVHTYSSWTARSAINLEASANVFGAWVNWRSDGTSLEAWFSHNGIAFQKILTTTLAAVFGAGNVPDRVGLQLDPYAGAGNTAEAYYRAFRYYPTATALLGRAVIVTTP